MNFPICSVTSRGSGRRTGHGPSRGRPEATSSTEQPAAVAARSATPHPRSPSWHLVSEELAPRLSQRGGHLETRARRRPGLPVGVASREGEDRSPRHASVSAQPSVAAPAAAARHKRPLAPTRQRFAASRGPSLWRDACPFMLRPLSLLRHVTSRRFRPGWPTIHPEGGPVDHVQRARTSGSHVARG